MSWNVTVLNSSAHTSIHAFLIELLKKGRRHASVISRSLRLYLWKTFWSWNMFVSVFTVYHGDKGLLYPTTSFCHGAQPHDISEIANADEYWLNPWEKNKLFIHSVYISGIFTYKVRKLSNTPTTRASLFLPLRQICQISQSPCLLIIYCLWRELCLQSFNDTLEDRRYFRCSLVVFKSSVFSEFYAKSSH